MFNKKQVYDHMPGQALSFNEPRIKVPVVMPDGYGVCVDQVSVTDAVQALVDAIGLQKVMRDVEPLYRSTKLPNKVAKKRQ